MSAPRVDVLATDPMNTPEVLRDAIYSVIEALCDAELGLRSAEYGEAYGARGEREHESRRRAYCEQRVLRLRRQLADLINDAPDGESHHRAALARIGSDV